MISINRIETC